MRPIVVIDPMTIVVGGLLFVVLVLIGWVIVLESRLKRLSAGKQAGSLEQTIGDLGEDVERIILALQKANQRFIQIDEHLKHRVSHVKTIRFNPFPDQGGNQSFATAILNEHGDGVVLSSLYARDKVSVYSKPITKRQSEYELTAEELAALTR